MRECCDSEEHPNTIPVILGLDVTGSMGEAAVKTAQALNEIMTTLYSEVNDIEFCTMGIGDLFYDHSPIQISQFESDVRIVEQLEEEKNQLPQNLNLELADYELTELIRLIKNNPEFNYKLMPFKYQRALINNRFERQEWKNKLLLLVKNDKNT